MNDFADHQEKLLSEIDGFMNKLTNLSTSDRSNLRKAQGKNISEAQIPALKSFYSMCYNINGKKAEAFFLIATLFAGQKDRDIVDNGHDFGKLCRKMKLKTDSSGVDKRLEKLLQADSNSLPFLLRTMVNWISSANIDIDWQKLCYDVCRWDYANRTVQIEWIESFVKQENF